MTEYLTYTEAAALKGVAVHSVRRAAYRGTINTVNLTPQQPIQRADIRVIVDDNWARYLNNGQGKRRNR